MPTKKPSLKNGKGRGANKLVGKQCFTVRDGIFHCKIHVFLNYSSEDFVKWAKSKKAVQFGYDDNAEANFAGYSTEMSAPGVPTEWIIVLKSFDWTITDQGTLIHEIVHTVIKIFATNNIPFIPETQEFIACMIGNMYEEVAAQIRSSLQRKKR